MNDINKKETKQWFGKCVEENMASLYSAAFRLTNNKTDAEELLAEAVTKAWESISTLDDRSCFRPWIFRVQRNIFISQYRKKSVRPEESPYEEDSLEKTGGEIASLLIQQPDEFQNWWANPEKDFVNNLLGEEIRKAVKELPDVFQETITLVNIEGFSYDDAAEILDVSPGTVRSRMNRGRTLLQKALWHHANDAGLIRDQTMLESVI